MLLDATCRRISWTWVSDNKSKKTKLKKREIDFFAVRLRRWYCEKGCERSQRHHAVMPQDAASSLPLSKRTRHVVQNGVREALKLLEAFPQCEEMPGAKMKLRKGRCERSQPHHWGNASGCHLRATPEQAYQVRSFAVPKIAGWVRKDLNWRKSVYENLRWSRVYKVVVDGFKVDDTPPTTPPLPEFRIMCPETTPCMGYKNASE